MRKRYSLFLIALALMISCTQKPEPIAYGRDACDHCKMMIMDQRYGAEIVTKKGKIIKFDAAECMVDFIKSSDGKIDIASDKFLTTDYAHPGTLIEADKSFFLIDRAYQSPMGGNLASFTSMQLAENNLQSADGKVLSWNELLQQTSKN